MTNSPTRARKHRARKWIALVAGPFAILMAGGLVWQSSTAAFTASTRNAGNSWTTGTVTLTDDDKGVAGFTVENLTPGATGQRCIVVTSGATVPGEVRAYVQNLAASGKGLEDRIKLEVKRGTGGTFDNDCAGFQPVADPDPKGLQSLAVLANANKDYATGGAEWQTTGKPGENTVYQGTWKFDVDGLSPAQVDALQGATVSIDLVWELQSTDAP